MAQLSAGEKNTLSHRGKTLRRLETMLPEIIEDMERRFVFWDTKPC
jgi:hypothetical protein